MRVRWAVVAVFLLGIGLTWWVYRSVPQAFVPEEDQGYFMVQVQAPAGASLEYTGNIARQAEQIIMKDPDVLALFSVMGFSFSGAASNQGIMFARLKPFEERPGEEHSVQAVLGRLGGQLFGIPGAIIVGFAPPSIPGLSRFGGFEFQVLDQTGTDISTLANATASLTRAGSQSQLVRGLFSSFTANDPQLQVTIDRQRALALGLPLNEITSAMQIFLGSQYVNDFEFNNRAYRVYVQADQRFRSNPQAMRQLYARTRGGDMVPLEQVVSIKEVTSPQVISHFNLFRSASINGSAARGVSSGDALREMERLAEENLPEGMGYAWSGISLEETKAGRQSFLIFGLALLLVYLTLAAQYESLVLPFIVLLGVPLAVLGALSAQWSRGLANDVYCQVGLVMLIGLAAKNAILIVEFAEQLRGRGMSVVEAAIEASRLRLRPILMTSLAFILGVLPLVFATGAGKEARNSVGTAVAGGMLLSTFLNIVFIPVLYVVVQSIRGRLGGRRDEVQPA
jgi:HAE1 family hydrophobic/amphiphilic exporter-1